MNVSPKPKILVITGLVLMVGGALDLMEGSVVILVGTVLAAAGTALSHSRYARLMYWSAALVAIGVAALFCLSWLGGIGGTSGRSGWLGLLILPYPIGWLLGLFGTTRKLREGFNGPAT